MHLLVRNRCVPPDVYAHFDPWRKLNTHGSAQDENDHQDNFSILFHDQEEINDYLRKERDDVDIDVDMSFVSSAAKCAIEPQALTDLGKLMLLWDYGGIVVRHKYNTLLQCTVVYITGL